MQGFLPGGQVGERAQGEGGGGAGVHSVLQHQAALAARDGRREDILARFGSGFCQQLLLVHSIT